MHRRFVFASCSRFQRMTAALIVEKWRKKEVLALENDHPFTRMIKQDVFMSEANFCRHSKDLINAGRTRHSILHQHIRSLSVLHGAI